MNSCLNCGGEMANRNSSTCNCNTGYYDKEESSVHNCVKCHKRYSDCSAENTGNACQGNFRKTLATFECECQDGYFESTVPLEINCL